MAQHDRNLIKMADIERFKQWLGGSEWRIGKGEYQLMQVKLAKGWGAVCIDASGIVTTPTEIAPLIKQFKSGKPRAAQPAPSAAVATISDKQYLQDLRDDFAMAALTGLVSKSGGPYSPPALAYEAYIIADAMIDARAKKI